MKRNKIAGLLLMALLIEKVIQHVYVTGAFLLDIGGIRSVVALDYRFFMMSGGVVAVAYGATFFAIYMRYGWGLSLVAVLAVFDVVGEFVAQGRFDIVLNVSFIVAVILKKSNTHEGLLVCLFDG